MDGDLRNLHGGGQVDDPGPDWPQLVVFSDDWGRHPSSCQHLVRRLLGRWEVIWLNTIGTRWPRLNREDAGKIWGKLRQWFHPDQPVSAAAPTPRLVHPLMWPGFRRPWQRRLNASRMAAAVHAALGPRRPGQARVALTTLPITADLVGRLDVDRWVYYCVDDLSVWPGLDAQPLREMEQQLAAAVDEVVTVNDALSEALLRHRGRRMPTVLTHGIDLNHWSGAAPLTPPWLAGRPRPWLVFWGLVDRRLDLSWCEATASLGGTLALVGPTQSPHEALAAMSHVVMPGAMSYDTLPSLAACSDVLVMPYADLPVTRAMQPLKFKEYLATGKPVVARRLPAVEPWVDAADLVVDQAGFVTGVQQRSAAGLPIHQQMARRRLVQESWDAKARVLEDLLRAG